MSDSISILFLCFSPKTSEIVSLSKMGRSVICSSSSRIIESKSSIFTSREVVSNVLMSNFGGFLESASAAWFSLPF